MKASEAKPAAKKAVINAATEIYRARLVLKVFGSSASTDIEALEKIGECIEDYLGVSEATG